MRKSQIKAIESIYYGLTQAKNFIHRKDIHVCSEMLPNLTSFYNKDGKGITPLNKYVGSDLVMLQSAISQLKSLLIEAKGYKITENNFFGKYQVSHPEIAAIVGEFNSRDEAEQHCLNG